MMNRHVSWPRRPHAALAFLVSTLMPISGYARLRTPSGRGDDPGGAHLRNAAVESCGEGDLKLAPPAMDVDGLRAVPIDIQRVDAKVVLDATAGTASVKVAMHFIMGTSNGYPIFDLRQKIVGATLNGVEVSPTKMAHHDFGGGANAELRVIEVMLPACSKNTLELTYMLERPSAPEAQAIEWDPNSTRVFWNFRLWDLLAGRFLESWFPANLIYDQFPFTLDLELQRSAFKHTLVTNGKTRALSQGHWRVTYPSTYTALSQMLVLVPDDYLESYTTVLHRRNGTPIKFDIFMERGVGADLSVVANDVKSYVEEFTESTGEYAFDDLTVYLWNDLRRSEEYDGAVTSNLHSLKHEIFHLWYGRGIKPASQDDGWIDEAWDTYNTSADRDEFAVTSLNLRAAPVTLSYSNPWQRITPMASYTRGAEFFGGLAALMGLQPLRDAMRVFYQQHVNELVTTGEFERHIYCASTNAGVTSAFHRFVYGRAGAAPEPNLRVCQ